MNPLHFDQNEHTNDELSNEQLGKVAAGIIIVGGKTSNYLSQFSSVMLNPQPLPPKNYYFGSY